MDFVKIFESKSKKYGTVTIKPQWRVTRTKDLLVKGKSFYAVYDDETGLWSDDPYTVVEMVDGLVWDRYNELQQEGVEGLIPELASDFDSGIWTGFGRYCYNLPNAAQQLDEEVTFANEATKREDYRSKKLPYSPHEGSTDSWDRIVDTLYSPSDREKIEWMIGAILTGEAKRIQKFFVFYGPPGSGKSTIIDIVQMLLEGYWTTFEAAALVGNNNQFALEMFRTNPLIAIEHDGDLSRVMDNSKINSLTAHEPMMINEKNKPQYSAKFNAVLLVGTNKPVKITDSKSGLIRRLIDIQPSGNKLPPDEYLRLKESVKFELGAIAHHCMEEFRKRGNEYYIRYRPVNMMLETNVMTNFVEAYLDELKKDDFITLKRAYALYKEYCSESGVEHTMPQYKFREELRAYYKEFEARAQIDGERLYSVYRDFHYTHMESHTGPIEETKEYLSFESTEDILGERYAEQPAQYASDMGIPLKKWADNDQKLSDLDTSEIHYVKPLPNDIVIDFDLKGDDGEKSLEANLAAAAKFPPTYGEPSKSGSGVHLHYIWDGDPTELSRTYAPDIEIKVFVGDSALRRVQTTSNGLPVSILSSGLPLKEKRVLNDQQVKTEKGLRDLIARNLRKEIHDSTKPSVDFIKKILDDAYEGELVYDVTNMRGDILQFAMNSTNQSFECIKTVNEMKFQSESEGTAPVADSKETEAFFDVEVFPNLFVICWKFEDGSMVKMINPEPHEVEYLLRRKLVGFNNRKYDNHILYGAYLGLNNEQLYKLSKKIVENTPGATYREAYGVSYTDIFDYATKKQSLKKWQIELGIHHDELGLPWDEPVPPELWERVAEYCANDVDSTEAVHKHLVDDFTARLILAELSGLTPNHTTNQHTTKIVFGDKKDTSNDLVYTDLSEMFPGYQYHFGKSTYRDIEVGEGGYVYAEPGYYENVVELDVASMHPTSIEELNLFGPYTQKFSEIKQARMYIKSGDFDTARQMMGGKLTPYLKHEEGAEALSSALKLAINSVYGLTAARFDNPFRDNRNKDNIVAKRGALFMVNLKDEVQSRGFTVVHIKTDSIKIANPTEEIIEFVMEYGRQYGYDFEKEAVYERFCLVNDAVYIAKTAPGKKPSQWKAIGAQFKHPYVFKALFTKEQIDLSDMTETKSVTTSIHLEKNGHKRFVGKVGAFIPMMEGYGGTLLREKDGEYHAVTGTKDWYWEEYETVESLPDHQDHIELGYFRALCDKAIDTINKYVNFEEFVA